MELYIIWRKNPRGLFFVADGYVYVESENFGDDLLYYAAYRYIEKYLEKSLRADYIEGKAYSIPPYVIIDDGSRREKKYVVKVLEVVEDEEGALIKVGIEDVAD